MTTLTVPSFEDAVQLLDAVQQEVAAEPTRRRPPQLLQLLRKMHQQAADACDTLENLLANGVEPRSFSRKNGPLLPKVEHYIARIRKLVERVSQAGDEPSKALAAELHLVEERVQAFRDLLTKALDLASAPPRPVDWERVRNSEEAFARGETKPFSRR